ncbi:hypothetical protein [Rhodococcus pseudokoreensis]|nr:hypothetical protein [Rhodococcus pseudokoreensis]
MLGRSGRTPPSVGFVSPVAVRTLRQGLGARLSATNFVLGW